MWKRLKGWKVPSYTNICSTYQKDISRAEIQAANLENFGGYLEARALLTSSVLYSFKDELPCFLAAARHGVATHVVGRECSCALYVLQALVWA